MSKDYRHCRAGLPDLVVWNTSENTYKVKSHHAPVLKDMAFQACPHILDKLYQMGSKISFCCS